MIPVDPKHGADDISEFLKSFQRPVVFIDRLPFERVDLYPNNASFVGFNSSEGGKLAARGLAHALRQKGLTKPRVLVICSNTGQIARQKAFVGDIEIAFSDMPSPIVSDEGDFDRNEAKRIALQYFEDASTQNEPYDAVFCTSDDMALGVVETIAEFFKNSGKRPIVFGYDGTDEAVRAITDSLLINTVVQDTGTLAAVAVDLLTKMRRGEEIQTENLLTPTLYRGVL